MSVTDDVLVLSAAWLYPIQAHCDDTWLVSDPDSKIQRQVASLLGDLEKFDLLNDKLNKNITKSECQEMARKMMLAMAHDKNVMLIKIAHRLALLDVSSGMSDQDKKILAENSMATYAIFAHKLGIAYLKWQIEDRCFKILQPEIYKDISKGLNTKRLERERLVDYFVNHAKKIVEENHILYKSIAGRSKHIYSIHNKMVRKGQELKDICDAIAIRVILMDVASCYKFLSILQSEYEIVEGI